MLINNSSLLDSLVFNVKYYLQKRRKKTKNQTLSSLKFHTFSV